MRGVGFGIKTGDAVAVSDAQTVLRRKLQDELPMLGGGHVTQFKRLPHTPEDLAIGLPMGNGCRGRVQHEDVS